MSGHTRHVQRQSCGHQISLTSFATGGTASDLSKIQVPFDDYHDLDMVTILEKLWITLFPKLMEGS